MNNEPFILSRTNWKSVEENEFDLAVLPWGATEPHNYHLPYGTDNIQSTYIAEKAAGIAWENKSKVVVLPTIPFGVNTTQMDLKLTININPSTQFSILKDIVESISRHKINKLVILNGHGGNDFKNFIRELKISYPHVFICVINWYKIPEISEFFKVPGDHAGEMETSNMLFIQPEIVRPLSEAGNGASRSFKIAAFNEGWAWSPREWKKVTSDTGIGNPKEASSKKGELYLRNIIQKLSGFLTELATIKIDKLYG
jgi:creatinine amidohydrolase